MDAAQWQQGEAIPGATLPPGRLWMLSPSHGDPSGLPDERTSSELAPLAWLPPACRPSSTHSSHPLWAVCVMRNCPHVRTCTEVGRKQERTLRALLLPMMQGNSKG